MRVSQHIEHHARRVKHHVQQRPQLQLLIAIVLSVILLVAIYSIAEHYHVTHQDIAHPVSCTKLAFGGDVALCKEMLLAAYGARAPEDREPVCVHRENFGIAQICQEYDEVLSERIYGQALRDQGISVWEPSANITSPFRYKTLSAISALHLVCNKSIVNATVENGTVTVQDAVNGTCILIAATDQGSITSEAFSLDSTQIVAR